MYEQPGTLARLAGHVLRRPVKVTLPAKSLAQVLLKVQKKNTDYSPDVDAAHFYALNQMVSLLAQKYTKNELLPDWAHGILQSYEQQLVDQHKRLVWYTFLVICREFRHLKNPATIFKNKMYTDGVKELHPYIQDSASESTLNSWLAHVPEDELELVCRCIAHAFNHGSFGGGYGGPPWGKIATTLADYVGGKISAEVFVDTAYTLAHNNGPMFNKSMLYTGYQSSFIALLDVQRSGQVCEALIEGQVNQWLGAYSWAGLVEMAKKVKQEVGGIGDYIDWYKVEALGSVHKYPLQKAAQDKKYGKPKAEPVKKVVSGKPIKVVGTFDVAPGQSVEVYERMAA